jgi:hypothetical protein
MAEYLLHCFAQSGNAYRAALMLNLMGADWKPVFVDFFNGETRTSAYRSSVLGDWSSRPEESHPRVLPDPCVNLSIHTKWARRRCSFMARRSSPSLV